MTKRLIVLCWLLLSTPFAAHAQVRADLAVPLLQVAGAERPVALQSATVEVEVAGGQAQTTLELAFHNPNARVLEGNLAFPLRPGQDVVGFALDIDGRLRDAVPVEKARGRQVFEAIERRGVDPALLERTQGNFFRLRIFPLPAHGSRRVRIVIAEPLESAGSDWRLRLPLQFAASLDAVPLRVRGARPQAAGAMGGLRFEREGRTHVAQLHPRHLRGDALELRWPRRAQAEAVAQRVDGETYFVVDVPMPGAPTPRTLPARVGLLWDASGSARRRDPGLDLAVLDGYFRALGHADVRLVVLRDRAESARGFRVAGGDWSALKDALKAIVPDGATDLGAWTPEASIAEYMLVSDGLGNYGDGKLPALAAGQRVFALNTAGASADSVRLRAFAEDNGGRLLEVASPRDVDAAVAALLHDAPRLVAIDAVGAQDVVAASPYAQDGWLRLAGRLTSPEASLGLTVRDGAATRRMSLAVGDADATEGSLAARTWAGLRLRELAAEPERNRTQVRVLGQRFGIATAQTSLIVLETLEDYLEHDIVPPAELRVAFDARRRDEAQSEATRRAEHLARIVGQFQEKVAWWETDWARRMRESRKKVALATSEQRAQAAGAVPVDAPMAPPAPAPAAAAPPDERGEIDEVMVTGSRITDADRAEASPVVAIAREDIVRGGGTRTIRLQAWEPDSPVARRLRAAPAGEVYALYLDERTANADSVAFHLDVADILFEKGQRDLALRVLSNLAEMQLENRHVLRVLGYRLLQAQAYAQAVHVFEQVRAMADEEPQSHRDLALAYAGAGRAQDAVDALYDVVARPWDDRFGGVALIALAELNAIVADARTPLDTRRIDPRLLRNLPLALRAVLTWDADNTDMDLWVTQPDGEKVYYGHDLSAIGGTISDDFTGGYGPEEYSLRRAPKGKYKVEVDYFGSRSSLVTGAVTVQLWLSTGFGTEAQRDERVTLRLHDAKDHVLVGEFEVR